MTVEYTALTTLTGLTATPNYSSDDALGTLTTLAVPFNRGVIESVVVVDLSDTTGINIDIMVLGDNQVAGTAVTPQVDNAVFSLADADVAAVQGVVQVNSWFDAGNSNAVGTETNVRLPYVSRDGNLYLFCISRGAHNLVAVTDIRIAFGVCSS